MADPDRDGSHVQLVRAYEPVSHPGPGAVSAGARFLPALPLSGLLAVLTLLVLLPLLGFGAYSLSETEQAARADENERLRVLALDLANAVDRELAGQIATAQMLSAARSLVSGDILEFWRHAEDAGSRANGHFILIDPQYQQLVNTRAPIGSELPRTANSAGVDAVMAHGEPTVGNIGVGAVAQAPLYSVRVPVIIEGETRYVLSYVPRQGAMLDVLRESYRPQGWRAAIIDANGLILARSTRHDEFYGRPVSPEVWQRVTGEHGILSTVDLEGNASLTAFSRSRHSGWTVFVWVPEAILREPAMTGRRMLLYWAAVALIASLFAAWMSGRLIGTAARRLVAASEDLAAGRPVRYTHSVMQEANLVGRAIQQAAQTIAAREAELQSSKDRMRIVLRELSHRSLNLLTVIQLIARQSGRVARDFAGFMESFTARITGLAQSHNLLLSEDWRSVSLADLVRSQIGAFICQNDQRLRIEGPALQLQPQAVQHLGMALHELATNALKHGALSASTGRLDVTWRVEKNETGEDRLHLVWQERGGPPVEKSERCGFGRAVIETLAPSGLGGTAHLDWRVEGLAWHLDAPLCDVIMSVRS
jgi:two-component sensor histidine kinase